jgi:hypothetical protein
LAGKNLAHDQGDREEAQDRRHGHQYISPGCRNKGVEDSGRERRLSTPEG